MKKSLLLAGLLVPLSTGIYAQCVPVFSDGFESGSYTPTWSLGPQLSPTVTTTSPAVGNYRLEATGGNLTHLDGLSTSFPAATPTTISWWINPQGNNASISYFVAGNSAVTASNCIVFCYYVGSVGTIRFVSGFNYERPANTNQWYHIELRNINWSAHTFDIYIDNGLEYASFPFRSPSQNDISRIHLYNFNNGLGLWDNITVGNLPVTASVSSTDVSCSGNNTGTATTTALTGTAPYTYTWAPNVGNTAVVTGLIAGTYTCTVTDANGCTTVVSTTVTEPAALSGNATNNGSICPSGTATLSGSATGGLSPYVYGWMPGNLSGSTVTDIPPATTNYTLTVTDANGCTETSLTTVTVHAVAPVSLGADFSACGSATLDAQVPGDYAWSDGSTTQVINVTASGSYDVVVTDANGCSASDTVDVTINTFPVVAVSAAMNFACAGEPSILLSGSPAGGTWSGAGVSGNSFSPDTAGVGTHDLVYTYTDPSGCTSMDSLAITADLCLGVAHNTATAVNVYPNPNHGTFVIAFPRSTDNMIVELLDVNGRTVFAQQYAVNAGDQKQLDLSGEAGGMYLLRITSGNMVSTQRVLITE